MENCAGARGHSIGASRKTTHERGKMLSGLGVPGICTIGRRSSEPASMFLVSVTRGVAGMDIARVDTTLLGLPPRPTGAFPGNVGVHCTSCMLRYPWRSLRSFGTSRDSLKTSWQNGASEIRADDALLCSGSARRAPYAWRGPARGEEAREEPCTTRRVRASAAALDSQLPCGLLLLPWAMGTNRTDDKPRTI